jgi:hypothetical protein
MESYTCAELGGMSCQADLVTSLAVHVILNLNRDFSIVPIVQKLLNLTRTSDSTTFGI